MLGGGLSGFGEVETFTESDCASDAPKMGSYDDTFISDGYRSRAVNEMGSDFIARNK